MTTYLLGMDVDTTGCKALPINADGVVRTNGATGYPIYTPQLPWAQQDSVLAGVGVGMYQDVTQARQSAIQVTGRTQPGPDAPVYADYYPRYRALYPALAPEFESMARVFSQHV